jgi:hypothetical protein
MYFRGLIYLKNINIFSIQEPAIASQVYRDIYYIHISLVVAFEVKL